MFNKSGSRTTSLACLLLILRKYVSVVVIGYEKSGFRTASVVGFY